MYVTTIHDVLKKQNVKSAKINLIKPQTPNP